MAKEKKETILEENLRVGNRVYAKICKPPSPKPYALILEFQTLPTRSNLMVATSSKHVSSLYPTETIGVRVIYSDVVRDVDSGSDVYLLNEQKRVTEKPYDELYNSLSPRKYNFDRQDKDADAKLTEATILIRRYKPLFLWLKLAVKATVYTDIDKLVINNFVSAISSPPNNLSLVADALKIDDRQESSHQTHLLGVVEKICKNSGVTEAQKNQVKYFYDQLKKILSVETKKAVQPANNKDNGRSQINPYVTQLMRTEAYQDLIDRIKKIEKRVDLETENVNNKKNILKADGILALEEAFELALYEQDNAKSYKIISQAITANSAAISAYVGWFSEEFFYFFTHNKSTSDGLLKEISTALNKCFPEEAKSQFQNGC